MPTSPYEEHQTVVPPSTMMKIPLILYQKSRKHADLLWDEVFNTIPGTLNVHRGAALQANINQSS